MNYDTTDNILWPYDHEDDFDEIIDNAEVMFADVKLEKEKEKEK